MGNHLSCISSSVHILTIKVLNADNGHISEFQESMKAAELMLENPNHFVIHASSLQGGQRISPLSADDELKLAHIYILLPMQKLHSRLTQEERATLSTVLAKSECGRISKHGQSKVAPLRSDSQAMEQVIMEFAKCGEKSGSHPPMRLHSFQVANNAELSIGGSNRVILRSKSWVPKLETIIESSLPKA